MTQARPARGSGVCSVSVSAVGDGSPLVVSVSGSGVSVAVGVIVSVSVLVDVLDGSGELVSVALEGVLVVEISVVVTVDCFVVGDGSVETTEAVSSAVFVETSVVEPDGESETVHPASITTIVSTRPASRRIMAIGDFYYYDKLRGWSRCYYLGLCALVRLL